MRTTPLLALALLAPSAIAAQAEHIVYLHENPLHALPEVIRAHEGDTLTLTVENPASEGKTPHKLVVCGDGADLNEACADPWATTQMIQPGASAQVTFVAKRAGTFEYYCSIPGHKGGGMKGTLLVEGDAGDENALPGAPLAVVLVALGALALAWRRTP